ncbi:hypothetical protein LOK49_LG01G01926 [Camellia lanceoleosa]|uniref:Uncharacterized protein n=1 Tax=Camellia lanceoleosa TaxID=1840588 RepID=A0ACC0IVI9_9ERIC|nr:hypothetical protein LOK49_LG01G01926 [Camellia lanceoleosa]
MGSLINQIKLYESKIEVDIWETICQVKNEEEEFSTGHLSVLMMSVKNNTQDIIKAADIFLQDEVVANIFDEKVQARETSESEGHAMLMRVVNGLKSFWHAVKLALEVWTAMLIRMTLKPEVHKFTFDIISALLIHFS